MTLCNNSPDMVPEGSRKQNRSVRQSVDPKRKPNLFTTSSPRSMFNLSPTHKSPRRRNEENSNRNLWYQGYYHSDCYDTVQSNVLYNTNTDTNGNIQRFTRNARFRTNPAIFERQTNDKLNGNIDYIDSASSFSQVDNTHDKTNHTFTYNQTTEELDVNRSEHSRRRYQSSNNGDDGNNIINNNAQIIYNTSNQLTTPGTSASSETGSLPESSYDNDSRFDDVFYAQGGGDDPDDNEDLDRDADGPGDDSDHEFTKELVLALRNIGDTLETKLRTQDQSTNPSLFFSNNLKLGKFLVSTLRRHSVVGVAIGASLEFSLLFKRL